MDVEPHTSHILLTDGALRQQQIMAASISHSQEAVYNGHPWVHKKWLFYRGDLLAQVEMYTKGTLGSRPLAVMSKVTC